MSTLAVGAILGWLCASWCARRWWIALQRLADIEAWHDADIIARAETEFGDMGPVTGEQLLAAERAYEDAVADAELLAEAHNEGDES